VRPSLVVVSPPVFYHLLGVRDARKPFGAQAFLTEPAVEAFDEGVLNRLPGRMNWRRRHGYVPRDREICPRTRDHCRRQCFVEVLA